MTLGNLVAIWQDDVRRLIGWSSVSQSGYALMAVCVIGLSASALPALRSEEHTSELQSLMRISYAVFCLTKKNNHQTCIIHSRLVTLAHEILYYLTSTNTY